MVIPRIGASITGYGLSVVNQLDMMGVPVLNDAIPIARSRDKLRALQLLSRFGLDIPRTAMCRYRDEVAAGGRARWAASPASSSSSRARRGWA